MSNLLIGTRDELLKSLEKFEYTLRYGVCQEEGVSMISELSLKVWERESLQLQPYPSPLFPPSPYYRFFQVLAKELKPKLSVVLGVCGGGDCLHLALGYPEGQVIGIDIVDDHSEQLEYIKATCLNFNFCLGDSIESAELIYKEFGPVDILFIDTVHTVRETIAEFEAWQPYLSDRAIVCFDDLLRMEMSGFWDYLEGNKLRLDELHPTAEGGFGVWWK